MMKLRGVFWMPILLPPDGYRQQFRKYKKPDFHTYVEFASEKLRQFKKWLEATNTTTFSELINLIVMEEWKNRMPFNILRHVEERGECELMRSAKVADAYALLMGSLSSRGRGSQYNVRSSFGESFGGVGGKPTGYMTNAPNGNFLYIL